LKPRESCGNGDSTNMNTPARARRDRLAMGVMWKVQS